MAKEGEMQDADFEFKMPTVDKNVKEGFFQAAGFKDTAALASGDGETKPAAGGFKKQISKKEKMQLKHQKFMSQLTMPGEKPKPVSALSNLSSLKGMCCVAIACYSFMLSLC